MALKLKSTGGGSVTIDVPNTASDFGLNLPAVGGNIVTTGDSGSVSQAMIANGVAGKGPTIRVCRTGSAQSLTVNTATKVLFDTVVFDTNSNFSVANSRFTPTVAGYYQVSVSIQFLGSVTTAFDLSFYKNGSRDTACLYLTGSYGNPISVGSAIIYCNGSSDFIEVYAAVGTAGISINHAATNTVFSASLVRAA
jgi:hypothetical protein